MLGVLFRGVFFLGVIGWYSSSLWRMIDGYFKDQFQRYLEEEYRRNPKMRDNVAINNVIPAAADKLENPPPIDTDDARLVAESLQDTCSSSDGDKCQADTVEPRRESRSSLAGELIAVAGNEVARPVEQSEFLREEEDRGGSGNSGAGHDDDDDDVTTTAATTTAESLPLDRIDEQTFSSRVADAAVDDDNIEEINIKVSSGRVAIEEPKPQEEKATKPAAVVVSKPAARKRRKSSARSPTSIGAKPAKTSKVVKKRKIKLLSLTDEDFERAWEQRRRKYKRFNEQEEEEEEDFSEFDDSYWDDDHREQEEQTGVLVSDLPFKPAIDIYDLERLPEDEFCPLTLEDDPTCEETRFWP
ncbi:hypothetical protein TKK_0018836 [Trichogramma kaykai]|uniref:Uncharacterized protein n=1 Tax=Trichogramma kaykai TaxID=54128 RepID=A0ABD2VVS7_9HYME